MTVYLAFNCAFATTTGMAAGTSYAAGAKVAIQLDIPATIQLLIVEYGVSFNGSAAATPAIIELAECDTASTCSSAHTTSSIKPLNYPNAQVATRLNFGAATDTGYGNGAITSATTERYLDAPQFVAPTNQFTKQFPLGREPRSAVSKFVQFRINTSATVTALAWIAYEEV
jgi:hypothetical protein